MTYPLVQSVGVVVFNKGSVLLVRHGKASKNFAGVLGLPSGKVDPGETNIHAAIRELQEETGLVCRQSDAVALPKSYRATIRQKDGTKIFDFYVFYCKKYTGRLRATDETEPFWHPVDSIATLKVLPNVPDAIVEAWSIHKPIAK